MQLSDLWPVPQTFKPLPQGRRRAGAGPAAQPDGRVLRGHAPGRAGRLPVGAGRWCSGRRRAGLGFALGGSCVGHLEVWGASAHCDTGDPFTHQPCTRMPRPTQVQRARQRDQVHPDVQPLGGALAAAAGGAARVLLWAGGRAGAAPAAAGVARCVRWGPSCMLAERGRQVACSQTV